MPAFLEIGNDPVIRLWSVREVGDLRSNAYSGRLILTSGPKEWCLLGMGQDSLEVSFCLCTCFNGSFRIIQFSSRSACAASGFGFTSMLDAGGGVIDIHAAIAQININITDGAVREGPCLLELLV